MARAKTVPQPAKRPAADVWVEVGRIAGLSICDLRHEWRAMHGADPPKGLTKDLIARALTYRLQERAFGGLSPAVARMLRELGKPGSEPRRQVKAGSIIVREYGGVLHEVLVVPGGFCWQGQIFDSLSTIAKRITGTSWNGPRFFGLRSKRAADDRQDAVEGTVVSSVSRTGRRSSIDVGARSGEQKSGQSIRSGSRAAAKRKVAPSITADALGAAR